MSRDCWYDVTVGDVFGEDHLQPFLPLFVYFNRAVMADVFGEDQIKKFKVIFEQFDANGDGDISAKELKGALRMLGQKADTKSCKKMIKVVNVTWTEDVMWVFQPCLNISADIDLT